MRYGSAWEWNVFVSIIIYKWNCSATALLPLTPHTFTIVGQLSGVASQTTTGDWVGGLLKTRSPSAVLLWKFSSLYHRRCSGHLCIYKKNHYLYYVLLFWNKIFNNPSPILRTIASNIKVGFSWPHIWIVFRALPLLFKIKCLTKYIVSVRNWIRKELCVTTFDVLLNHYKQWTAPHIGL